MNIIRIDPHAAFVEPNKDENQRAIKLYQKNGYAMESTSPSLQLGKSHFQFIRMKKQLLR